MTFERTSQQAFFGASPMFLIALGTQELASWDGANGETKASEAKSKCYFQERYSQKEKRHEYDTKIKNSVVHLHWQMDTEDSVFAWRQTLSPRAVAPPTRERVAAHADQNSSQPRIRRFNRQARYGIEDHCCRVFADHNGKDNHRSTQRHVSLREAISQGCECRCATCAVSNDLEVQRRDICAQHASQVQQ